jgi:type I restriction enzyme M protein
MAKKAKEIVEEPLEKKLWKAADKLRKNMDAAEYKHVALGLIFLKYISDAFEELYNKLKDGKGDYEGADPEDKNEYVAEKVFYVPPSARWTWLQGRAKLPTIGKDIDDAMDAIEKDNPSLKGVLPKVYAQEKLDKGSLGGLVDLVSTATLGTKEAQSKDLLGRVFEYFLGEFALAEGKKGGQFYTPESVVKLLVEMLEPYEGRVFDPCCGSGGMFVQSEKFIKHHQDYYKKNNGKKLSLNPADHISIYGQESNQTTWRLAKMNLSIRGIDSSNVKWNNEGSFLNDAHKDLKADYIIANPPFNDSDWSGELLQKDARWVYGVPPSSNANFAWIQHFLFHLSNNGTAGFVLSNAALTSTISGEGEIRQKLVDSDLIECIVNLPTQLFYNTGIPATLWFLSKAKKRKGKILFIEASKIGFMADKTQKALSIDDIQTIANTFHTWKNEPSKYEDTFGFSKSATKEEISQKKYLLNPGRYVGVTEIRNDLPFPELRKGFEMMSESYKSEALRLEKLIKDNFKRLGYKDLSDVSYIGINSKKLLELVNSIYTHWFLDFEFPYKGGSYKTANGKFVIEDGFELPTGWECKELQNYCNVFRGASPRPITDPRYFSNGTIPWIKIADATASTSIYVNSTKEMCTELAKEKSRFIEKGNLILSNSATVGIPMILNLDGCIHDGWLSFDNYNRITRNFLFFTLTNKLQYLTAYADGSVQKNLNTGILKELQIIVPTDDLIEEFDNISQPILDLILIGESQEVKKSVIHEMIN